MSNPIVIALLGAGLPILAGLVVALVRMRRDVDSLKQGQDDQIRRIAALEQASSETIRTLTEIRERMSGVESAVRAGFEATNKRLDDFRPVHP